MDDVKQLRQFLRYSWKFAKLYDKRIEAAANAFNLTRNEKDVLLFLHNNKGFDTAKDIVKYRSISKSLVAKSVASLTQKGYLTQMADATDARNVHLFITQEADALVQELKDA